MIIKNILLYFTIYQEIDNMIVISYSNNII